MKRKSSRIAVTLTLAKIIKKTGQAKAEILGQTFSEYISELIRADNKQIIDAYIKEQMQDTDILKVRQTSFDEIKPPKKIGSKSDPNRIQKTKTPKEPPKQISIDADTDYITPQQLADILEVSTAYIQRLLKEGKINGHQDNNKRWHIPKEEVTRLQAERSMK